MKFGILVVSVFSLVICFAGCERVERAQDALNKAKELKADFRKKSDQAQKDMAGKVEDYKDRLRKKVGLESGTEGNGGGNPVRQDDREDRQ